MERVICNLTNICGEYSNCMHREEHTKTEQCEDFYCQRLEKVLSYNNYKKIIKTIQCEPIFIQLVKDTIKKHDKKHKKNDMQ